MRPESQQLDEIYQKIAVKAGRRLQCPRSSRHDDGLHWADFSQLRHVAGSPQVPQSVTVDEN
jgi:hypothetical protein